MKGLLIWALLILSGIILVLFAALKVEKKNAKVAGKKVYDLKELRKDLRRVEEKQQNAEATAAKRARRAPARKDSLENARIIRELVDGLNRDARTAAMAANVPTIHVREEESEDNASANTHSVLIKM